MHYGEFSFVPLFVASFAKDGIACVGLKRMTIWMHECIDAFWVA